MSIPTKWASGDRAVIYVTFERFSGSAACVRLPGGDLARINPDGLMMLSPNDPTHSAYPVAPRRESPRPHGEVIYLYEAELRPLRLELLALRKVAEASREAMQQYDEPDTTWTPGRGVQAAAKLRAALAALSEGTDHG